jgi:hypothetical protein
MKITNWRTNTVPVDVDGATYAVPAGGEFYVSDSANVTVAGTSISNAPLGRTMSVEVREGTPDVLQVPVPSEYGLVMAGLMVGLGVGFSWRAVAWLGRIARGGTGGTWGAAND